MGILSFLTTKPEPVVSDELIEKYRYINVDDLGWWDYTYERHQEKLLRDIGWWCPVEGMQFTGFWVQGDGASFEGNCHGMIRIIKFLDLFEADFPIIRRLLTSGGDVALYLRRGTSRYRHENTVHLDIEYDTFTDLYRDHEAVELRQVILGQWNTDLDHEMAHLERVGQDYMRARMRELYRDLEREYDHLISDEAVRDTIIANDLHEEN